VQFPDEPIVEGWSNDIKACVNVLLVAYFTEKIDNYSAIVTGKSPQNVRCHQDIDRVLEFLTYSERVFGKKGNLATDC